MGLTEIDKAIAKIEGDVGVVKSDLTGTQSRITQLSNSVDVRINSLDGKELISRINLSPTGTRIDGRLLHVTSDAVFDQNVITKGMIQAGAVTADKMQVDSLSAITQNVGELHGGTIIGGTFRNNDSSFQVLPNGDIIGANIIGSRIDAKSVYAEGEQLKPVHVSTQVVDSGDKIVLPEGYSIEKSIIYVLEYDLINSDYFTQEVTIPKSYSSYADYKYRWKNFGADLPNSNYTNGEWISGDREKKMYELLNRRFPVHVKSGTVKRVDRYFSDKDTYEYRYDSLANRRAVWGVPFEFMGYMSAADAILAGTPTEVRFPKTAPVKKDFPAKAFRNHIVGIADDGACFNCAVRINQNAVYVSWGTIKVCVVSFW